MSYLKETIAFALVTILAIKEFLGHVLADLIFPGYWPVLLVLDIDAQPVSATVLRISVAKQLNVSVLIYN